MAFVDMHNFSRDFLHLDMSLLLLTFTLRGVSNKHCLLSLFSFVHFSFSLTKFSITDFSASFLDRVFKFCIHDEDNEMYY